MEECYHSSMGVNTPPWVIFTFLKLYKCYQIAQRITYEKSLAVIYDVTFDFHIIIRLQVIYCKKTIQLIFFHIF